MESLVSVYLNWFTFKFLDKKLIHLGLTCLWKSLFLNKEKKTDYDEGFQN